MERERRRRTGPRAPEMAEAESAESRVGKASGLSGRTAARLRCETTGGGGRLHGDPLPIFVTQAGPPALDPGLPRYLAQRLRRKHHREGRVDAVLGALNSLHAGPPRADGLVPRAAWTAVP